MEQEKLLEIYVLVRRMYNLLGEILDHSVQISEAIDRNDQITIQMLLSMRREPILELAKTKECIQQRLDAFSPQCAAEFRRLLNGGAAEEEGEKRFAAQVASNMRLGERVRLLDQQLSQKIARDKSVYSAQ